MPTMRRIAICSAVLAPIMTSATATADTPGCVSRHEFGRIQVGMSQTRVHKIFDTAGAPTRLGAPNIIYSYRPCRSAGGVVQVSYDANLRVVGRTGNWFG